MFQYKNEKINNRNYNSRVKDKNLKNLITLLVVLSLLLVLLIPAQKVYAVDEDISASFTDPNFRQAVWEWLGNTGEPGSFTRGELAGRLQKSPGNYTLDVRSRHITSLNGIENFQGLYLFELHCPFNDLESLPELPNTLESLECQGNKLTELPVLPATLKYLYCHANQLTTLPSLPDGLELLYCCGNNLNSLPELPYSLTTLKCERNNLTAMPDLPDSLEELWCGGDNLYTELPQLNNGLRELHCVDSNVATMPDLPASLKVLECRGEFTTLPDLPAGLETLWVQCLNTLPVLPDSLKKLDCNYNYFTNLPDLPGGLIELDCAYNRLVSLPNLPASLTSIDCSNNFINVFAGLDKTTLDNCSASTKHTTPQYRCYLHEIPPSLSPGSTWQMTQKMRLITSSSNGTEWGYGGQYEEYKQGEGWFIYNRYWPIDAFTFSSSDDSIASVSADGMITAQGEGVCNIYAMFHGIDSEYTKIIIPVRVGIINPADNISDSFTDPNFRQAVWEWLGNTGEPGSFTKQDLIDRMPIQNNILDVSELNITSLEGLQNFDGTGLQELSISSCHVSSLPTLPDTLTILNCSCNLLSSLPALPDTLTELWCSENQLSSLPTLPDTLTILECTNNQLSSLPALPDTLGSLSCGENQLRNLPALPDTLVNLYCQKNLLTNLTSYSPQQLGISRNYINIWAEPIKSVIEYYGPTPHIPITPQYKIFYQGNDISMDPGQTRQIEEKFVRQLSDDGETWYDGDAWYGDLSNVALDEFTFSSSDNTIATVDEEGVITAHNSGSCEMILLFQGIDAEFTRVRIPVQVGAGFIITPNSVKEGYEETSINVNGHNTHFVQDETVLQITDKNNTDVTGNSSLVVTDATTAAILLKPGLVNSNSPYSISLSTGGEVIMVSLLVEPAVSVSPSIAINPSVLKKGYATTQLVVSGNNTHFQEGSTSIVIKDKDGTEIMDKASLSITDENSVVINLEAGLLPAQSPYTIILSTGSETVSGNLKIKVSSPGGNRGGGSTTEEILKKNPYVRITSPENGQSYTLGSKVHINGEASDVSSVKFLVKILSEDNITQTDTLKTPVAPEIVDVVVTPNAGAAGESFNFKVLVQNKPSNLLLQFKLPNGTWMTEDSCKTNPAFVFDVEKGVPGANSIYTYSKDVTINTAGLESQQYQRWFRVNAEGYQPYEGQLTVKPPSTIRVYSNNQLLKFDIDPFITNGSLMVPLKDLCDSLDIDVSWDHDTKRAIAGKNETTIEFVVGATSGIVNGQTVSMDQPAMLINSKAIIPLRYICDAMGFSIKWDEQTTSVNITTNANPLVIKHVIFNQSTYIQSEELVLVVDVVGNPTEVILKIPDLNIEAFLYNVFGWEWATYDIDLTEVGSFDYEIEASTNNGEHKKKAGTIIVDSLTNE
ncbi:MAG: hypothetical protein GX660_26900 [Clostridiaceae bacterium]|nr:hypothetical protein [Clostridiaceae bacterium]